MTPDQWLQFTAEVIQAAKLTFAEDAAAWTTGVTTGALSSPLLLVFAPVVGYYAGKSVHKKTVVKKVRDKLATEGPLRATLRQWNEGVFLERGIQLWLEPPTANGEVIIDAPMNATPEQIAKAAKKQAKRFRLVCSPHDPRDQPMGTNYSPTSPSQSQKTWSPAKTPTAVVDGKNASYFSASPVEMSAVRPVAELGVGRPPVPSKLYELDSGTLDAAPSFPEK